MEQAIDREAIKSASGPKEVFGHLLTIVTLYVSVVAVIALLFQYISILFPDKLEYYGYQSALSSIRWASAALIVVWPVYLLLSWMLGRDMRTNPLKRMIRSRKWLLYLTLFLAAITIISDLVSLVFNFYGGELTTRFFLKTLVVLAVAGAVFWYYIWDLRREAGQLPGRPKQIAWLVSAVLGVAVVVGFFIAGSPAYQRQVRFDQQRVNDLQNIQSQVLSFWQNKNTLPQSLDELSNSISGFAAPKDPETGTAYAYRTLSSLGFELCADFSTDSKLQGGSLSTPPVTRYDTNWDLTQQNWSHGTGRACFTRTIDPQLYRLQNQIPPAKY